MDQIKVVPIMVGSIRDHKERLYGELLSKYINEEHLFIISSDFCHWGSRFQYTYYQADDQAPTRLTSSQTVTTPIHKSIEKLDRQAIQIIEKLDIDAFQAYLKTTKNTICGRHPIAVLLYALEKLKGAKSQCVKYAQSSHCKTYKDSSVSYASIYVQLD
jgi:AmmeMemoRadiSam system protein B